MSSTAERSLSMARPWVQDPAWLGREGGREGEWEGGKSLQALWLQQLWHCTSQYAAS